jgi:type II secretory pathway predicted ATPase ExeA
MIDEYRHFYGFVRTPFSSDLSIDDVLETSEILATRHRFDYAVKLGSAAVITGEIGSGKSTALRYAASKLHPSEYKVLYVTAGLGSILDLYRTILSQIGVEAAGNSRATMVRRIKKEVADSNRGKKVGTVLVIDEASLLRLEVFTELHTLCQFEKDSKPLLPMILAGQSSLVDKMKYPGSAPFASRVVARSHLQGVDRDRMKDYLLHHLNVAGVGEMLFDETAVTAIQQGSGGLFRKANLLARGALIAAARKKSQAVGAEHVRLAATEIF